MISKVRKRDGLFDAVYFSGSDRSRKEVQDFVGCWLISGATLYVKTKLGCAMLAVDSWVVQYGEGDYAVFGAEEFNKLYVVE